MKLAAEPNPATSSSIRAYPAPALGQIERRWAVYVRRSYREATAAEVSDETQHETAMRLVPPGAPVVVIRDSGGHNSGRNDRRDGFQRMMAMLAAGQLAGVVAYDPWRLARNTRLTLNLLHEVNRQGQLQADADSERTRFDQLRKQHEWGDISDEASRAARAETQAAQAQLPADDKLVLFDRNRQVLGTLAANISVATPAQRAELVSLLVDRVVARDGRIDPAEISWTRPARPFFASRWLECPQGDSNP